VHEFCLNIKTFDWKIVTFYHLEIFHE